MSVYEVFVYTPDDVLIGAVGEVVNSSVLEEKDGVGGGSFTIRSNNASLKALPTLLEYRNIVRVRIDGVFVGAWWIKNRVTDSVEDGGAGAQKITVSGPGLLSWLEDALVYPEKPTSYSASTRWFNWGSQSGSWMGGEAWGYPNRVARRGGTDFTSPSNPFRRRPANWPKVCTDNVFWVWNSTNAKSKAPWGQVYLRYEFTVAQNDTDYVLYMTAKDSFSALLDGEPLMNIRDRDAWVRTYEAQFTLNAGTHVLGIRGTNATGGFCGVIAALVQVHDNGAKDETYSLVARTGWPGWKMLAYTTQPPGWSAGEVWTTLLAEATARGVDRTPMLTPDFGHQVDSDGAAWDFFEWKATVGDTYASFLESMRDFGVESAIDPETLDFRLYGVRGTDKSDDVVIDAGVHLQRGTQEIEAVVRNTILSPTDSGWITFTKDASISAYGRVESYLDLSTLPIVSVRKVVAAVLQQVGLPIESVTAKYAYDESNKPWTDFGVGDWVSVSAETSYKRRRVVSIAAEFANDRIDYTVEFDSVSKDLYDRLALILKRAGYAQGTMGGVTPAVQGESPGGKDGPGGHGGGGDGFDPNKDGIDSGYRDPGPVDDPTAGVDDPWLPPDDGSGGAEEVLAVGTVSKAFAEGMMSKWAEVGATIQIALLSGEPIATDGEWDISAVELGPEGGYVRATVSMSLFDAPTGNNPVVRKSNTDIPVGKNTGTVTWVPITHAAVLNTAGTAVLSVVALPAPVSLTQHQTLMIPGGKFHLTVESV